MTCVLPHIGSIGGGAECCCAVRRKGQTIPWEVLEKHMRAVHPYKVFQVRGRGGSGRLWFHQHS
jgi:hypothetical protein